MPDFPILGFLCYGAMSGYDIRRRMTMSTAHFYKASFGSIYPALERMEVEGLVAASRSEGSSRQKKVYELLPKGREAFLEWLASPIDLAKGPSALLIRLFFLGSLTPAKASKTISAFRVAASERRTLIGGVTKEVPIKPDFFQISTQRFGIEYYAFMETWLARLEAEIGTKSATSRPRQ